MLEPVADGLGKAEKLVFSASSATEPGLLVIEEPIGFQEEPDTCTNESFHQFTDHGRETYRSEGLDTVEVFALFRDGANVGGSPYLWNYTRYPDAVEQGKQIVQRFRTEVLEHTRVNFIGSGCFAWVYFLEGCLEFFQAKIGVLLWRMLSEVVVFLPICQL